MGAAESRGSMSVDVVERMLPGFAPNLPAPIRRPTRPDLVTGTDLLYSGFRSGIVHEAHIPPSAGKARSSEILSQRFGLGFADITAAFPIRLSTEAFPAGATQARGGHLRDGGLS